MKTVPPGYPYLLLFRIIGSQIVFSGQKHIKIY